MGRVKSLWEDAEQEAAQAYMDKLMEDGMDENTAADLAYSKMVEDKERS